MIIIGFLIVVPLYLFSQNLKPAEKSFKDSSQATSMFDMKRNAVYNEDFLGFFYERLLPLSDKFGIALKGGFMIWDPLIPAVETAAVFGSSKHFFETGAGALIAGTNDDDGDFEFFTLRMGYRYQAPKGFLFKASAIYSPDNFILPLITLGYSF